MDENRKYETDDWGPLADALRSYEAPPVPDKARLIARLTPLVEARRSTVAASSWDTRAWLSVIGAQVTLLEPPFWVATLIMAALGVGIALFGEVGTLPTLFIGSAPLLGAAGVAYAYRPATEGLRELERISPIRPLELLYARLIPVLLCDMTLAVLLLTVIWARMPDLILWRLIVVWLGPLLGLTGLALYSAVRWGGVAGVATPVMAWGALNALGWVQFSAQNPLDPLLATRWLWLQSATSNWALIGSGAALVFGCVCVWGAQRALADSSAQAR